MKKIITLSLCLLASVLYAQQTMDSLYQVTYSLGASWDKEKPPHQQTYFKEHSAHLSKLRKDGIIKLGARYEDKGVIFISAKGMSVAKELINSDQAVINQLFITDIQKLNLFYEGCVEKPK